MSDGLDAARALLPGVHVDAVARLGGGERTTVTQVRASSPDGVRSLVVKQYRWGAVRLHLAPAFRWGAGTGQ